MTQNLNKIVKGWFEERERIRLLFRDEYLCKATKEALLRRLRTLETLLDEKGYDYNTTEFADWVHEK